jgi:hypothetical protein
MWTGDNMKMRDGETRPYTYTHTNRQPRAVCPNPLEHPRKTFGKILRLLLGCDRVARAESANSTKAEQHGEKSTKGQHGESISGNSVNGYVVFSPVAAED